MLPRRHRNSGKAKVTRSFPSHLQWIRGFACACFKAGNCDGRIEAAHVDYAGGKGVGIKVADYFAAPLCATHHAESHRIGIRTFEAKYGVSLLAEAQKLARVSPHRHRWEQQA